MATVVEPLLQPNMEAVTQHLALLFGPCASDYPDGLVEIAHGKPGPDKANLFPITRQGMAEAVAYAVEQNRRGDNVYVGVNPRRPGTPDNKRASARDIEIAFWHFADLDHLEVVNLARERLKASDIRPMVQVTTGRIPSPRVHLYWQLEEPVRNLEAWSRRQEGIADTLSGDRVIDTPRVMRLSGMVSYPSPKKEGQGYVTEIVTIKSDFDEERLPVTPEQIVREFPIKPKAEESPAPAVAEGQTTLGAMARSRSDELIAACLSGSHWHNNMRDLVAHLVGIGTPKAVIMAMAPAITLPGYTVQDTLQEMGTALRGAYDKWGRPPEDDEGRRAEEAREQREGIFPLLDLDELEALPPPEWLIHEMIVEDGLTVIYGDPGAGKSFVALDMALRLALGMDWHGTKAKSTGVLYIAGEGARGLGKRVKGWRREHGMEGADAPFLLLPVPVAMLQPEQRAKLLRTIDAAAERAGFHIGLVVVDTVSRALAGAGENGADEMGAFVAVCDAVRLHIGGAVLGVHHSGKDKERGMRGSTVLLGACDGTIRIEKDEQTVTLKTEKQKDAEEAAPIYMTMKKVSWAQGLEEEQSTLVPFRSEAPVKSNETLNREQIEKAFGVIADAWGAGKPLSTSPNTREQGRYAAAVLAGRLGADERLVRSMLTSWLENDCLEIVEYDKHSKSKGLRVLNPITRNG
jgi:hypothetical protein